MFLRLDWITDLWEICIRKEATKVWNLCMLNAGDGHSTAAACQWPPLWRSVQEDWFPWGHSQGRKVSDGLALRIVGSLRVTEEGWINSSLVVKHKVGRIQTACAKKPVCVCVCMCVRDPGIPCQTYSLSGKINIVKVAACKERKGVYLQRCKQPTCCCLNKLPTLFHIVIPVVYTFKYAGYNYHQQRH